ncbi:MAG: hypothetical protein U1E62_08040 [Alsobacter sp.]
MRKNEQNLLVYYFPQQRSPAMPDLSAWRKALAGQPIPLHENDPQEGFWRLRQRRDGAWLPVAIWREPDGELQALRDGEPADPQDLWTWCCRHPVSYEAYRAVAEDRQPWPEDVEPLARPALAQAQLSLAEAGSSEHAPAPLQSLALQPAAGATAQERQEVGEHDPAQRRLPFVPGLIVAQEGGVAGLGHNSLAADPAGLLLAEILALRETASDWLAVASPLTEQIEADRAANFAERFSNLEKQAEAARVAAKAPILEAGRAIDATWKPVVDQAASGKSLMKRALEPFLKAERERLLTLQETGDIAAQSSPPRAGTQGRRIGLRQQRRVVLRDRDALIRHYRREPRFWEHEGVAAVLLELADADLKAGRQVPGAELIDSHVAA